MVVFPGFRVQWLGLVVLKRSGCKWFRSSTGSFIRLHRRMAQDPCGFRVSMSVGLFRVSGYNGWGVSNPKP